MYAIFMYQARSPTSYLPEIHYSVSTLALQKYDLTTFLKSLLTVVRKRAKKQNGITIVNLTKLIKKTILLYFSLMTNFPTFQLWANTWMYTNPKQSEELRKECSIIQTTQYLGDYCLGLTQKLRCRTGSSQGLLFTVKL